MQPQKTRPRVLMAASVIALVLGVVSLVYCVYDLLYPIHFVGDMYGMELAAGLACCGMLLISLVFGGVALWLGWRRGGRAARIAGSVLVLVVSALLVASAAARACGRWADVQRRQYPKRSVQELLRIAADKGDVHAVDALGIRGDPAAVPGLRRILMDERAPFPVRYAAVHALGMIGGPEALKALEDALAGPVPVELKQTVTFELTRLKQPEGPPRDKQ